jgi:hypothetical protein
VAALCIPTAARTTVLRRLRRVRPLLGLPVTAFAVAATTALAKAVPVGRRCASGKRRRSPRWEACTELPARGESVIRSGRRHVACVERESDSASAAPAAPAVGYKSGGVSALWKPVPGFLQRGDASSGAPFRQPGHPHPPGEARPGLFGLLISVPQAAEEAGLPSTAGGSGLASRWQTPCPGQAFSRGVLVITQ